jgi:predicted RNA binding protein YcfA (HicA-like mRNA interferase family)
LSPYNKCVTFMKYSELQRILEQDGWYIERTGKHHIYIHPIKPGMLIVGKHGSQEVPKGTQLKTLKKAGLK